jgi:hypothetical protein
MSNDVPAFRPASDKIRDQCPSPDVGEGAHDASRWSVVYRIGWGRHLADAQHIGTGKVAESYFILVVEM